MSDTTPPSAPQVDEEAIRRVGRRLVDAFRGPKRDVMGVPEASLLAAVLIFELGVDVVDKLAGHELASYPAAFERDMPIAFAAVKSGNAHRVEHALAAHKAGTKRTHKTGAHNEYEAIAALVRT